MPPSPEIPVSEKGHTYSPHFELTGRISVRDGQRGEFGQLRWIRSKERQQVLLLSPLGNTVAEISQSEGEDAILRSGNEVRTALNFEALVQDVLGTPLPINEIAYWIQGATDGVSDRGLVKRIDPAGRPQKLLHAAWEISIDGYRRTGDKIFASRIFAINGDKSIKIIVDDWKPLP